MNLTRTILQHVGSTLDILPILKHVGSRGKRGGAAPPSTRAPPERLRGGTHGGGSFNITSACSSLPQARHSGVPRGAVVLLPPLGVPGGAPPPGKYKIERKQI